MVILSVIGVVGVFRVSAPVIVVVFVVWWWMINVHFIFHFVDRCLSNFIRILSLQCVMHILCRFLCFYSIGNPIEIISGHFESDCF